MLLDRVARPALQSRRSRDKSRRLGQALGTRVNHSIAYPALLLELDPASATMLRQIVIEGLMLTIGPHGDRRWYHLRAAGWSAFREGSFARVSHRKNLWQKSANLLTRGDLPLTEGSF